MTIAIAAAGTGGHVLPGIAVAETIGSQADVVFIGGDRFEKAAVPAAGYELVEVRLRGLQRRFTMKNLLIPFTVLKATSTIAREFKERGVTALLCTGGYVTVPAALAARRVGIPYFIAEQNAHAGLANRLMARKAKTVFTSFAETEGLERTKWVGNPVRRELVDFSRRAAHREAFDRYGQDPHRFTLGVVGGSLGSGVINQAVAEASASWDPAKIQIVHLAGDRYFDAVTSVAAGSVVDWQVVGFEDQMEVFYGAIDLLLSRAGGMVAEITATGTPVLLVPGEHGSAGHQAASARVLARGGAAVVLPEAELGEALRVQVERLESDRGSLRQMAEASRKLGKPDAAQKIAEALLKCS